MTTPMQDATRQDPEIAAPVGVDAFFRPRGIAVIGASEGNIKAGGRTLHNLGLFGYQGNIYPVSPRGGSIQNHQAVQSISDIDGPVDLAVICVQAKHVPQALRDAGTAGIAAAVVYAAGFDSPELAAELENAQRESGVRVMGPNTVGMRMLNNDGTGVFATFSGDIENGLTPGPVAVVAQSGGLGVYFGSAYLRELGIGTKYLLDTGAEMDVDGAELVEYLTGDDDVRVIAVLLEGAPDGRRLQRAVTTAREHGKHVVFLKVGRSAAAAEQVASHTGSMVGSAQLFDSAMRDAGAIVVQDEGEFIDAIKLCASGHRPAGRRLGVVTPSGGFGILAIDAAERYNLEIPAVSGEVSTELEADLANALLANPLDYMASGPQRPDTLAAALSWMGSQPNIDAVILWQAYVMMREDQRDHLTRALEGASGLGDKPLFGCGITTPEFEQYLAQQGMQWWNEPTRLLRTISLAAPARQLMTDAAQPAASVMEETAAKTSVVMGPEARALLSQLPHAQSVAVQGASEARALAAQWGKLVLKVEDPRFPHKTEYGLVSGLVDAQGVDSAFEAISAARDKVGAHDVDITAQRAEKGVELAFGGYNDPVFGASVMVALGGIYLEIDKDMAVAVAPIEKTKAKQMILSLRAAQLLQGARGGVTADIDAAADALAKFSDFYAEHSEQYSAVDINPVMVKPEGQGVVAVDLVLVPSSAQ